MPADITLLERLPDPVLLVAPNGETLYGNRAFQDLVNAHAVPPRLAALFGPPAQVVLAEARRSGSASAFLPLVVGHDPNRGYRLNVRGDAEDGSLAVQLTDLTNEVAWRHQLFLRNSELTVLNDIGTALSGTLELDVLARRIWEQTGRIMENTNFVIALHDNERNLIRYPLWVEDGQIAGVDRTQPFGNGATEYLLLCKQPLLLNGDVNAQLEQLGVERFERPCVSLVGLPILADSVAVGVLLLRDFGQPNRYGRHELGILNIVATQASAAIRNARLYEATRRAYDELTAAQARLLESERLRTVTETVGALNHEVNNPLATIVGTAQLLLRREDMPPETRAKIERVLDGAKRIQSVTSKMASLIQATSRPYPGQTQIIDLRRSLAASEPSHGTGVTQIIRVLRESSAAANPRPAEHEERRPPGRDESSAA